MKRILYLSKECVENPEEEGGNHAGGETLVSLS
jgi:hypothetical protein